MSTVTQTNETTTYGVNIFTVTAAVYLSLASLAALTSFLSMIDIFVFRGIEWIRIHLVTLGVILQFLYGYLPRVISDTTTTRLDIWGVLNIGIITFLTGRYLEHETIMLTGGIILFIATLMFTIHIIQLTEEWNYQSGSIFYLTGLIYFFLGITMGTGIWLGWNEPLQIGNILEVHIHANNWGLLSFVFAGLFLDKYNDWFGKEWKWPGSTAAIYWLFVVGAFGLVVGPWIGSLYLIVPGLIAHLLGTSLLVLNITLPQLNGIRNNTSLLHLVSAYLWFLAPVFVAPLVLMGLPGIPGGVVEGRAPESLIFGWGLQIILMVLINHKRSTGNMVGDKITLLFLHLGGILLWIGIFADDLFYALAYLSWFVALIPFVIKVFSEIQN